MNTATKAGLVGIVMTLIGCTAEAPQTVTRHRPDLYDKLGYTSKVEYDFKGIELAPKGTKLGAIQRVTRWMPIYESIEKEYALPKNLLASMSAHESYGDPVQPNASSDGGFGMSHIQGTTAELYGLNIYGSSKRDSDKKHGKQIKEMIEKCDFDTRCIQKYDERGHLIKNLDTAARIVSEGMQKYNGNWKYGVEYYRIPGRVGRHTAWFYLHRVEKLRKAINDPKMRELAAKDFERRNPGHSFNDYIEKFNEMNYNWDLDKYKTEMAKAHETEIAKPENDEHQNIAKKEHDNHRHRNIAHDKNHAHQHVAQRKHENHNHQNKAHENSKKSRIVRR